MNEIRGTLDVLSHLRQGQNTQTLTAALELNRYSEHAHVVTAASAQDIVLPDATGFDDGLTASFRVFVAAGSSTITAKTYHATTPVTLRAIEAGRAYEFTLTDNSDAAGTWHVNLLEEADQQPSDRHVETFDATTSWGSASGGLYTITITAATHGRGTTPMVDVLRDDGTNLIKVGLIRTRIIKASGNVVFSVPAAPDLRFAGQAIIV